MTSIHFVVHPLPGTEDQLNDRYLFFVCVCCVVAAAALAFPLCWLEKNENLYMQCVVFRLYLWTVLTLSCVWIRVLII